MSSCLSCQSTGQPGSLRRRDSLLLLVRSPGTALPCRLRERCTWPARLQPGTGLARSSHSAFVLTGAAPALRRTGCTHTCPSPLGTCQWGMPCTRDHGSCCARLLGIGRWYTLSDDSCTSPGHRRLGTCHRRTQHMQPCLPRAAICPPSRHRNSSCLQRADDGQRRTAHSQAVPPRAGNAQPCSSSKTWLAFGVGTRLLGISCMPRCPFGLGTCQHHTGLGMSRLRLQRSGLLAPSGKCACLQCAKKTSLRGTRCMTGCVRGPERARTCPWWRRRTTARARHRWGTPCGNVPCKKSGP